MNNILSVISDKLVGSAQFVFVHKLTLIMLEALYYLATSCDYQGNYIHLCFVCVCELSEIIAFHYEIGLITMIIMYMQFLDLFDFPIYLLMLHSKFLIENCKLGG